jgi:AcrR family transcriptional regulator
LALIDADGLAAFSLRSLAKVLNVSAPALYWHFADRNAILAEVVALVVANVTPRGAMTWQEFLRQLIRSYREALHRHPNAAPLLGAEIVTNSATDLALVESILFALHQAGFTGAELVAAYNATCVAMVGFAVEELCPVPANAGAWQQAVQARLSGVSAAEFPLLSAHLPLLADQAFMLRWRSGISVPLDAAFDCYLEVFIAGLEVVAGRASKGARKRGKPPAL